MSKKKKSKAENEENKNHPWGNKNYRHAAGEIEALRAMLRKRKKDEKKKDEDVD